MGEKGNKTGYEKKSDDGSIVPMDEHEAFRNTEWYGASLLLLADIVGSGVLALTGAFSKLGWILGFAILLICAPLNFYTGILLSRIRRFYPKATTYGALGYDLFGNLGGYIGWGFLYVYIFLILGEYQIVLAKSVQECFYETKICRPVAGLIACGILLFSNQVRTMRNISLLSIISALTIVIVIGMCLNDISDYVDGSTQHDLVREISFWDFFGAVSTFVFAWAGQKIYLEIMNEMKEPEDFPKSLCGAYPIIMIGYLVVCSVGYGYTGRQAPGYLLDALDYTPRKSVANILMFVHMQISYTLNLQVLSKAIHMRWNPTTALTIGANSSNIRTARFEWFVITSAVTGCAYLISNLIPFFDDFVELVGALLSSQLAFILPCVFFVKLASNTKLEVPVYEKVAIACIVVFATCLVIFGTIDAFRNISENASEYGLPFDCFCEAKKCLVTNPS